eukprot:403351580
MSAQVNMHKEGGSQEESQQMNGNGTGQYEEYLAVLEEHRRNSEREGNFVEAQNAKQRIEELKIQEGQRQLEQMMLNHQQSKQQMEDAQMNEFQNFNQSWDQSIAQKEQEYQQLAQQLEQEHTQDLEKNRIDLEQKIPQIFKASSELLNLKRIQDQLARQKEYAEAHKVQLQIQSLEREEQEKYVQVRNRKIVSAETLLIQKQQQQMYAFRLKFESSITDMRKRRDQDSQLLLQKFNNSKREMETNQNLERIKHEKQFGKQLLASQTSLSYGQSKDNSQFSATSQNRLGSPIANKRVLGQFNGSKQI